MKFSKEEKKFWQCNYRIERVEEIPADWTFFKSVDGDEDDDFFYFFTLRVTTITEVHLKETLITDRAVEYIVKFEQLKTLYLRKHDDITKESIQYFNQMKSLESLNITRTKITLSDLCVHLNNQSLREVFIDSEENEEDILEKAFVLKERMPNCNVYIDTSFSTNFFGKPEKPIF